MKSCPVCSRTFEDTLTFCLIDGSVLSAPFDAQATVPNLAAPVTDPSANETMTRVGLPHNAGFQASPSLSHNQFVPTPPPVITGQKPLTAWQVIGMWTQLILAIIVSLVLSAAAGMIVGAIVIAVFDPSDNYVPAAVFIPLFIVFGALLTVTIRWWRRKRRRAGLL